MIPKIHHSRFDTADELEEFINSFIDRSRIETIEFAGGKWIVWFWKV